MLQGKGLLTPLQRSFIAAFATLSDQEQFYLAGGTALAEYYFGHRLSFDLDFFTGESALVLPQSYQIETLRERGDFEVSVIRRFTTFVEFSVISGDETLKVDLAQDSPFRFRSPVQTAEGIWVSDILDLQVDKLLAYYGRAEPRDAADLYFILERESIEQLLTGAGQKDPGFDLYWFAVALNRAADFPDELARWPVQMLRPFEPPQLKARFQELAVLLLARATSGSSVAGE